MRWVFINFYKSNNFFVNSSLIFLKLLWNKSPVSQLRDCIFLLPKGDVVVEEFAKEKEPSVYTSCHTWVTVNLTQSIVDFWTPKELEHSRCALIHKCPWTWASSMAYEVAMAYEDRRSWGGRLGWALRKAIASSRRLHSSSLLCLPWVLPCFFLPIHERESLGNGCSDEVYFAPKHMCVSEFKLFLAISAFCDANHFSIFPQQFWSQKFVKYILGD